MPLLSDSLAPYKSAAEIRALDSLVRALLEEHFASSLRTRISDDGVRCWVVQRKPEVPLCHIENRIVYGIGTSQSVPIITGYEKVAYLRGGVSYPVVAGPFKGRGWRQWLITSVHAYLTSKDPHE